MSLLGLVVVAALAQDGDGPRLPGVDFDQTPSLREGLRHRLVLDEEPYPGTIDQPPAFHWRVRLPGEPLSSATHSEYSRPVVHDGEILVGSARGDALYRFSRTDGTLLGRFPASAAVQAEPLVVDDRVYFGDIDGVTWAYTLDGTLLWTYDGTAPILSRPTLHQGLIFVTNVDDLAIALDAETGALVWRHQAQTSLVREAELRLYGAPPAIPLDDNVLLGFSDGSLVAVEAQTGEERWALQIGEGRYPDIIAEPVPWEADVYASAYFEPFVAIDRASRTIRWRAEGVGASFGVQVDDGLDATTLYHPGTDGRLRAFSALTGAERWVWSSGSTGALTAPVLTPVGLFVGTSDGTIHLVDDETGRQLWKFQPEYQLVGMSASPVAAGRQLLFVTNAGYLYSLLAVPPEPVFGRRGMDAIWSGSRF